MKLQVAEFVFLDKDSKLIKVRWLSDDVGRPAHCEILFCGGDRRRVRIDNQGSRFKPCVTHCLELINRYTGKKPKTEFAKKRAKQIPDPVIPKRTRPKRTRPTVSPFTVFSPS